MGGETVGNFVKGGEGEGNFSSKNLLSSRKHIIILPIPSEAWETGKNRQRNSTGKLWEAVHHHSPFKGRLR